MSRRLKLVHIVVTHPDRTDTPVDTFMDPGLISFIRNATPVETERGINCVVCISGSLIPLAETTAEIIQFMEETETGYGLNPREVLRDADK